MHDPVDTDALRTWAAARADNKLLPMINAAADEVDRLRAYEAFNEHSAEWWEAQVESLRSLIENAPHDSRCTIHPEPGYTPNCTCWKASVS